MVDNLTERTVFDRVEIVTLGFTTLPREIQTREHLEAHLQAALLDVLPTQIPFVERLLFDVGSGEPVFTIGWRNRCREK